MPLETPMQQASGTAAAWTASTRILRKGEVGIEQSVTPATDVRIKVGDGVSLWSALPYFEPVPGGSALVAYIHTQGAASTVWTINHGLGYNPGVTLLTVGGMEFEGDVLHTTVNQTVCTFVTAIAGTARLV